MFYYQFISDHCSQYSIIIEEDGKVCYAYLLFEKNIIGDVWLYNQEPTPTDVPWRSKENMPFLNPMGFAKETNEIPTIEDESEVRIEWKFLNGECSFGQADILVRGKLVAVLKENSKPGWSLNAKNDGPLARVL